MFQRQSKYRATALHRPGSACPVQLIKPPSDSVYSSGQCRTYLWLLHEDAVNPTIKCQRSSEPNFPEEGLLLMSWLKVSSLIWLFVNFPHSSLLPSYLFNLSVLPLFCLFLTPLGSPELSLIAFIIHTMSLIILAAVSWHASGKPSLPTIQDDIT